jgi:type I restriction enzyme S subunit
MRANTSNSGDLALGDFRLDASYHSSPGRQAIKQLLQSGKKLERLDQVCLPAGIFIPGRFKRIFVDDPLHGAPYLTGSSILEAEPLKGAKYLSYLYTANMDQLQLTEKMILITCSGEIGNSVYVSRDLKGVVGSPDLIRVRANPSYIPSGYLFAYLNSLLARSLIQQKTYGAVIPHIEAHHIVDLPIPRLDPDQEERIHLLIENSSHFWSQSLSVIQKARSYFDYLNSSEISNYQPHDYDVSIVDSSRLDGRLGAHYQSKVYRELEKIILSEKHILLSNACKRIYAPPPFKHIYLPQPNKYPFLTGGELRNRLVSDFRYLSPLGMKKIDDYVVKKNWIALFKSGSLDSMFASVFLITDSLDGFCLSDHVIRLIVSSEEVTPEYICAFLSTWAGRLLIVRRATGMAVPFVREDSVSTIPIPILRTEQIQEITNLMRDGYALRQQSINSEYQAQKLLAEALLV